jgi:hypothetical protein
MIWAIVLVTLLAYINDYSMHGHIYRMRYLQKHCISHYIAHSAILYELEFETAQGILLSGFADDEEKFEMIDLLSCRRMLLMSLGQKKLLSPELIWYIENRIIAPLTATRMFFTKEGTEVVKLYMYYGIINGDDEKVNRAVDKITELRNHTLFGKPNPKGIEAYYNWILDIGQYRRVYDRDILGKKRKLLGVDYPYNKFSYYQSMRQAMERNLMEYCEFCTREGLR